MPNALQAVIVSVSIALVLLLGATVVGTIAENNDGIRMSEADSVLLEPAGTWTSIDSVAGYDETVVNSRGYAVNLTGQSDSYVQSKQNVDLATDDNWTISVWGYVDQSAVGDRMTLVDADGKVVIRYDGINKEWEAWYYDEGNRNSYTATASARDQPENWGHITVTSNGSHLSIYHNGTVGETANITTDSISDAPTGSGNWHGRIDEIRTFDDSFSDAQVSSLHSDPVGPRKGTNRTARAMFDEPSQSTQLLFFTDTDMTTSNATFSDGLAGKEMDGVTLLNQITGSTDYQWNTEGPQIKAVSGGELDGAPVAYVDYERETALANITGDWASAIQLGAMIPMVLIIIVIVGRVRDA